MSQTPTPPTTPAPLANPTSQNAQDGLETYNKIAETVGLMPSLRFKDNLIQAIIVLVGGALGAIGGYIYMQGLGAIFGALAGVAVFGILSGIVLMVLGWIRALKKK